MLKLLYLVVKSLKAKEVLEKCEKKLSMFDKKKFIDIGNYDSETSTLEMIDKDYNINYDKFKESLDKIEKHIKFIKKQYI